MKIAFAVDGTLIVVLSAAGLVGLFALHAAYPGLYDYWPRTSADLASWVQAVGAGAAIFGAFAVASRQERARLEEAKESAKTRTLAVLSQLEAIAIELRRTNNLSAFDLVPARMLADEYLQVARSIDAEVLSTDWIAGIYSMRIVAVRLAAGLHQYEPSPFPNGYPFLHHVTSWNALAATVAEITVEMKNIRAKLLGSASH